MVLRICILRKRSLYDEISPDMLMMQVVQYVVLGHSERRDYFGERQIGDVNESPESIWLMVSPPIMCCGKTRRQKAGRNNGLHPSNGLKLDSVTADQAEQQ